MMKMNVYIIRYILWLAVLTGAAAGFTEAGAQRAVFLPRQAYVRNDSLHLSLEMNLEDVVVNSYTAVFFTPVLASATGRTELPPVIVSGRRRFRFDRRQWALQGEGEKAFPAPYLILTRTKNNNAALRKVRYRISLPYATWMASAGLLMRQEVKDCCDLQLLGTDTVCRYLSRLAELPVSPRRGAQSGAPRAVSPRAADRDPVGVSVSPLPVVPATTVTDTPVPVLYTLSAEAVRSYAGMLSFLEPDVGAAAKRHAENVTLYLDYPLGRDDVLPHYKNNHSQLDKLAAVLSPLVKGNFSTIEEIEVCGYASPDGDYRNNERLAADRSRQFAVYMRGAYPLSPGTVRSVSVAEDWDGLSRLLSAERPYYMNEALDIIRRYGIFNGRERQLMKLWDGAPYKDMLHRFFPRLRRIEVTVRYGIRAVGGDEASGLIYTHPELLSLPEMYAVARYYRPGTEQYREVYEIAAYRFPDDVVANVNAASAVMLTGDLESARGYLLKVADDPRSWNNRGVLSLMEGDADNAILWFRRAVGIEPGKARRNLQTAQGMLAKETPRTEGGGQRRFPLH